MKTDATVVIIGAGLTGICASYYLSKNKIQHIVLEKNDDVGGIWSSLNWPGIRCDTDIIKYSFSFKPFLSDTCLVSGEAISNYLLNVSKEFGCYDKTHFGVEVVKAVFNSKENLWHVHTNKGIFKAKFLLNANGYFLDEPYVPEFTGSGNFKGEIRHLFHMDKQTNLENRKVVLVGSGASAISAAPAICKICKSITLLQRSPSYIYEDDNRPGLFVRTAQNLYKTGFEFPVRLINYLLQFKDDLIFVLFRKTPWAAKMIFRHHWKNVVDDKTYKEILTPSYGPWEQRIPVSIGLKEIIKNKKLNVVTGKIKKFTESGIALDDGRFIESDFCILATGFDLAFFKFDVFIDEQRVDTADINFYKSMMMGGIPNYFQPFGPPHSSFTRRVEVISRLIVKIILYMQKHDLDKVLVERRMIEKKPRITPNYVMRSLAELPVMYGTTELPSIDNLFYYSFRKKNYIFSGKLSPVKST